LKLNPRGRRPSSAVSARTGQRKASDTVIRIERSLLCFARGERLDGLGRVDKKFVEPAASIAQRLDETVSGLCSHGS
jgi:hypothetical protein